MLAGLTVHVASVGQVQLISGMGENYARLVDLLQTCPSFPLEGAQLWDDFKQRKGMGEKAVLQIANSVCAQASVRHSTVPCAHSPRGLTSLSKLIWRLSASCSICQQRCLYTQEPQCSHRRDPLCMTVAWLQQGLRYISVDVDQLQRITHL